MQQSPLTFYEPYTIWYRPFWYERWFFIGTILCLLLIGIAIICGLVLLYRSRKKNISPWSKALSLLKTLTITEHMTDLDAKRYYSSITDVLKSYFYDRYEYPVQGKTDTEVVDYLKEQKIDPKVIELYAVIVDAAIRYKFADQRARISDMKVALVYATEIINRTKGA